MSNTSAAAPSTLEDIIDGLDAIVWEGDAQTFQFTYVNHRAEEILGYPVARWLEPGFWASVVVHPDDREDAVAYCAMATAQRRDHEFEYRAVASDGSIVRLRDIVRVVVGDKGIPTLLRGLMIVVGRDDAPAAGD